MQTDFRNKRCAPSLNIHFRFQLVRSLEVGNQLRRDFNAFPGPGIPRLPRLPALDLETAEPPQLDFVSFGQSLANVVDDEVNDNAGVLLAQPGIPGDFLN